MNKIIFIVILCFYNCIHAGYISFGLTPEVNLLGSDQNQANFQLRLKIRNQGDSPAHHVQPILLPETQQILNFPENGEVTLEVQDILPRQEAEWIWNFRSSVSEPWRQGLERENFFYRIQYQDANAYPFSITHFFVVPHESTRKTKAERGEEPDQPPIVRVDVSETNHEIDEFLNEYSLHWSLQNPNARELNLKTRLNLPQELELKSSLPPLKIAGHQTLEWDINIRNKSALPGSKYNIFLRVYESSGERGGIPRQPAFDQVLSHRLIVGERSSSFWKLDTFFNLEVLYKALWLLYFIIGLLVFSWQQKKTDGFR